jgi:hypothetical protein
LYPLWGVHEVLLDKYASTLALGIRILRVVDTENGTSFGPMRSKLQCLRQGLPNTSDTVYFIRREDPRKGGDGRFAERDVFGLGREQDMSHL